MFVTFDDTRKVKIYYFIEAVKSYKIFAKSNLEPSIEISLKDAVINKTGSHCYYFTIRYDQNGIRGPFSPVITEMVNYICARTRKYGRLHI